jgi:hypothetical protein
MFWARLGSLHALESLSRARFWKRWLDGDMTSVSAEIKCPQNCRFCRWEWRRAGARDNTNAAARNIGEHGRVWDCAMTDSREG